jgi:hypothetical protein
MGALGGSVTLVTGASRGVGKGVALGLGEAAATVYSSGRTEQPRRPGVRPSRPQVTGVDPVTQQDKEGGALASSTITRLRCKKVSVTVYLPVVRRPSWQARTDSPTTSGGLPHFRFQKLSVTLTKQECAVMNSSNRIRPGRCVTGLALTRFWLQTDGGRGALAEN